MSAQAIPSLSRTVGATADFINISGFRLGIQVEYIEKLGPTTFQWRKNGINIQGATKYFYVGPYTAYGDENDIYDVVLTNKNGTFYSQTTKPSVIFYSYQRTPAKVFRESGEILSINFNDTYASLSKVKYSERISFSIFAFSADASNRFIIKKTGGTVIYDQTISGDTLNYTIEEADENFNTILYFYLFKNNNLIPLGSHRIYVETFSNITSHPQTQLKNLGDSVTFSATVKYYLSRFTRVTYQWLKDGAIINNSNARLSTYTINNISESDRAAYSVKVTFVGAQIEELYSNEALLNIAGLNPIIKYQPPEFIDVKTIDTEEDNGYNFIVCSLKQSP
jgi:hypothetical protein